MSQIIIKVDHNFRCPYTGKLHRAGEFDRNADPDTAQYMKKYGYGEILNPAGVEKEKEKKETGGDGSVDVIDLPPISQGARKLFEKYNVKDEEILKIEPTGKNKTIVVKDVKAYLGKNK